MSFIISKSSSQGLRLDRKAALKLWDYKEKKYIHTHNDSRSEITQ